MNIILCGFMGSGKSTVGMALAQWADLAFIDTDEMIEKEQGKSVAEIFDTMGEDYFRELEFHLCSKLKNKDNLVISTGGGMMSFERNVSALKSSGTIVFLDVPFEVIEKRVGRSETRPLFRDAEKARSLYNKRQKLYELAADVIVDGCGTAQEVRDRILKTI